MQFRLNGSQANSIKTTASIEQNQDCAIDQFQRTIQGCRIDLNMLKFRPIAHPLVRINTLKVTGQTIRATLAEHGMTVRAWARAHGFSEALVYRVLSSGRAPTRGESLKIALKLGIAPSATQDAPPALLGDLKKTG